MIHAVRPVAAMASYALADLGNASLISLAQNESAVPPSPKALSAGRAALARSTLYPDPDWHDLRRAIAAVHPVETASLLCGAGSMELIGCLIRAFAGPGDDVLGTQYGYLFVATAAQQAGTRYIRASETDYTVSIDAVLARVTDITRIVVVCNPGNPTGTRIPNADLLRLRAALPDNILLIIDQAYAEFDDQDHAPIFALVSRGETVVTRTLSKAYGLAGARVGWGALPPAIGAEVRKLLNPNNISNSSQAMAVAAIQDRAHLCAAVAEIAKIRNSFAARLRAAGYAVPKSATNFVLIPFSDIEAAHRADRALREAGYILRGMRGYGLPHCLRATIGAARDMEAVAQTLEVLA
ncbi:MAG: aminotransferase class I/II-fold pyridoxal phosphate-dependent enzyme [Rhodospirillales bacterium]|nr:aminotransferase class I/II-fold pyridoxal phosphate-dependent enzyme [Rhodospirillales bacterium]